MDPRILGCVRMHAPQNTDYSTVTPNEPLYSTHHFYSTQV
jgi:hypothetical protein